MGLYAFDLLGGSVKLYDYFKEEFINYVGLVMPDFGVHKHWGCKLMIMSTIFSFGEKRDYSITYYVYVHKNDYERAVAVLHGP